MLTDEIVSLAVGGAVGRNDWVHVFQISQMLPDGHASTPELLRLIEEHAASERQAMLEDANLTIVVLSTRYAGQNGGSSEGITTLSCSDLVKGYLESFGTLKVFNPNRDNAALQGGNPEKANGVWLRQWRRMLVSALETGGCVLRLDLEEAGLSDMQLAETDMAADNGVPVVTIEFNSRTTSADLRAALASGSNGSLLQQFLCWPLATRKCTRRRTGFNYMHGRAEGSSSFPRISARDEEQRARNPSRAQEDSVARPCHIGSRRAAETCELGVSFWLRV